jgi:hypothetical protein
LLASSLANQACAACKLLAVLYLQCMDSGELAQEIRLAMQADLLAKPLARGMQCGITDCGR